MMLLSRQNIKKIISRQPLRVVGKSLRNLFLPWDLNVDSLRKSMTIEITSACNAQCIFCTYKLNIRKRVEMNMDMFIKIITSSIEYGFESLDMTPLTGEMFLHKDAVHMISIAKNAGFKRITAFTNGISLNQHDIKSLLMSGLDILTISFPAFNETAYKQIFGVKGFDQFTDSVSELLSTHKKLKSDVKITFGARSNLSIDELKQSEFYNTTLSKYICDNVNLDEPVRVFDSWAGMIKQKDLLKGMNIDWCPIKSIYPLKKVYICSRLLTVGVLANGDVRLCNCRCDNTIETENDSLFIANLGEYENLLELLKNNELKINKIRTNFIVGKLPPLCRKCPFYVPQKY